MEEREQPLERGERGRDRVRVRLVEARLDRLRVPVAEVVEREVVEDRRGGREVETAEALLELGPRGVEPGEDPALLELPGRCLRWTSPAFARISRATFQSLIASRRPSSIESNEKRASWVEVTLSEPVARRVGAVRLERVLGIDTRAERPRHPPSLWG